MAQLLFGEHLMDADLVVFDKDGTLIDFSALWARYTVDSVEALMASLQAQPSTSQNGGNKRPIQPDQLRADLYAMMGYDPVHDEFDPHSPVVTASLPTLTTLAAGVLYRAGWRWLDAELQVQSSFSPVISAPPPPHMIRSTAPLPELFGALADAGVQIAVVTNDDRAPTLSALQWLEVAHHIAFIACADDGYPHKPAPDALWAACKTTGVSLERTVMVGDSTTDLLMAQRAGVALSVAVLTGTMDATTLAPHAHVVLNSIAEIRVAP